MADRLQTFTTRETDKEPHGLWVRYADVQAGEAALLHLRQRVEEWERREKRLLARADNGKSLIDTMDRERAEMLHRCANDVRACLDTLGASK